MDADDRPCFYSSPQYACLYYFLVHAVREDIHKQKKFSGRTTKDPLTLSGSYFFDHYFRGGFC